MKVFIATLCDYDLHENVGVYTDYEAARLAAEKEKKAHIFKSVVADVEEFELDGEAPHGNAVEFSSTSGG